MSSRSLYWVRSKNGILFGVCEGLAGRMNIHPWLVRGLWIAAVALYGVGLLLYLVLAFCLPREDRRLQAQGARVLGVCSKLAVQTGVDVGLLRVLAVLLAIGSFGTAAVIYVILFFVLPDRSAERPLKDVGASDTHLSSGMQ